MIRVDITRRRGVAELIPRREVASIVMAAAEAAGAPDDATVGVILAGDAELARLNATHMGVDGTTDVLSFPLLPPAAYPAHEGQVPAVRVAAAGSVGFALPPGEPVHLGDIVVSVERAVEQADQGRGGQTGDVRWSAADELRLLLAHGTLHLCGWDHAAPVEEAAMRRLERMILDASEVSAAR